MKSNESHKVGKRTWISGESRCRVIFGRIARLLLLAAAVAALWLTIENRWGKDFSYPTRYAADSHYVLGMMKLAKEGDLGLFSHITTNSLGAPFVGQLNDFAQVERLLIWLGGQLARVIGLMPAANTMLILSALAAAFSFYFAARLWRVSRLAAWVWAIAYAFLPQSQRSLDHFGVGFSGLLPIQLYCLWYLLTAQDLSWRSARFKLTFLVSLLSGLVSIYWVFLFINLYATALFGRFLKYRRLSALSFTPLITTCLMVTLMLGSFVIYRVSYGENSAALVRSYFDVERYALKPVDMLLPNWGPHLLPRFFSRYYNGGRFEVGELWWGAYIGAGAIVGLLLLFYKSIHRQFNKRPPSLPFLATCWIIAYFSFGGVHSLISLVLDFYDIRSINRYSSAVATIGLLYLAFATSRSMKSWPFRARLSVLLLSLILAVWDQSYKTYAFPLENTQWIKERVIADEKLVSTLEARLEAGAMLYMMPVVDFPEPFYGRGACSRESLSYASMRPFLYSNRLRYSYGSNKGRQGADWQLDLQELPAREIATKLEAYGFSGIVLNREGYSDRGERLLAEFTKAGRPAEFEQGLNNEWVFIRLNPSERPVLPTQTPYAVSVDN